MTYQLMLGNEALARGLVEADVKVVTSYPGTPSSEILPAVVAWKKKLGLDMYPEWSVNEKVALEVAIGASWSGKRAAVAMKQVGLNVASDALYSVAYTGIVGGLVVIVCDDPGPYSSQTEQDTRLLAISAKVPVLDPSTPREAKNMVHQAFHLSERYEVPVILRCALRVCHALQNVELDPIDARPRPANFVKDAARWAAVPQQRLALHRKLNRKLLEIEREFETSELNLGFGIGTCVEEKASLGVLTAGVPYGTGRELLSELGVDVPILKIATVYPLPRKLVGGFVSKCRTVLVLEEPGAAVELQISDRRNVLGRLDGTIPNEGELSPDVLYPILGRLLRENGLITSMPPTPAAAISKLLESATLPSRQPRLCPGCPHRSAFYSIRRILPDALFASDIGCYTLGTELGAVDTCLNMGAAVTIATGIFRAYQLDKRNHPIVATIGDSTFIHSGVTGLVNAVHTRARFILVILDNKTTAMTGFQPTPAQESLADGRKGTGVGIPELVRACGVRFLREIDPYDQDGFGRALKDATTFTQSAEGGVAVVIAQRKCFLQESPGEVRLCRVEIKDECDGCGYCLADFGCAGLVENAANNRVEIDRRLCVECGQCMSACPKGMIVESRTGNIGQRV